jgi:hypothetical protein
LTNWPPSEYIIAERFGAFFGLGNILPGEQELAGMCRTLGIRVSAVPLPNELRGYNYSCGGKRVIFVCQVERFVGATEHTLLHELREILEYTFQDLGYPTARGGEMESRAEDFACQTRVNAAMEAWKGIIQDVKKVSSPWRKYGAYVLISFVGLVWCYSCAHLPTLEDRSPLSRVRRNTLRT